MCIPYFVNLNNNTFQLKRYYSFTFAAKENKNGHRQLSNLQCCHFGIVIGQTPELIQKCARPITQTAGQGW